PGRSPPLIIWQVRQLPLPRSNAIFWPSAAADCARAGLANVMALISNAHASIGTRLVEEPGFEEVSFKAFPAGFLGCLAPDYRLAKPEMPTAEMQTSCSRHVHKKANFRRQ